MSRDNGLINLIEYLPSVINSRVARYRNKAVAPRFLTYIPTWRCPAKCVMCEVWKGGFQNNSVAPELSADNIKHIFRDKMLRKIKVLKITGGEPTMKEDLPEIMKIICASTRLRLVVMNTNGFDCAGVIKITRAILASGVSLHLRVSVDGIGQLHDQIRGLNGAFNAVYRTLEALKALQREFRFHVSINQTIMDSNKADVDKVKQLADDFGFGYDIGFAVLYNENSNIRVSFADEVPLKTLLGNFNKEEVDKFHFGIEGLDLDPGFFFKMLFTDSFFEKVLKAYIADGAINRVYYNKKYPKPPCMVLFNWVRFLPNGDVSPCHFKSWSLGNLNKNNFSDIWSSRLALEKRLEIKKCKGCWNGCNLSPSAVYSGDIVVWLIRNAISGVCRGRIRPGRF